MKVLVAGGRLQGTEIAFLAREAGWNVVLADRCSDALASWLCDEFLCLDIERLPLDCLAEFDLVFPAIEDLDALLWLQDACNEAKVAFAFDEAAYRLSSSKRDTDRFLAQLGIHTPPSVHDASHWNGGYVAKPNSASGSKGVVRFDHRDEALGFSADHPDYLCQAFLEGPVLSIEVVCSPSQVTTHCITEVVVGEDYDCHRIVAPAIVSESDEQAIRRVADRIGRAMDMRGIFDIELIMHDGEPYILEIDARMPSQTPIATYFATGVNLVVETAKAFLDDERIDVPSTGKAAGSAVLQHVRASLQGTELIGECNLSDSYPLERADGLHGSDMALVAGSKTQDCAYATLVVCSSDTDSAMRRMRNILDDVGLDELARKELGS